MKNRKAHSHLPSNFCKRFFARLRAVLQSTPLADLSELLDGYETSARERHEVYSHTLQSFEPFSAILLRLSAGVVSGRFDSEGA